MIVKNKHGWHIARFELPRICYVADGFGTVFRWRPPASWPKVDIRFQVVNHGFSHQDINGYNASWDRCDRTFKPDLGLDQKKAGHWFHLLKPSSTWPVIVVPRGGANQPISQSAMTSRAHGQRMRCEPLCHEVHLQNHPPWSWYVDCILEIIWFIWHSDSEFMKFQHLMISWTWCYGSASAIEHWIVQCCSLFVQIGYTLIYITPVERRRGICFQLGHVQIRSVKGSSQIPVHVPCSYEGVKKLCRAMMASTWLHTVGQTSRMRSTILFSYAS